MNIRSHTTVTPHLLKGSPAGTKEGKVVEKMAFFSVPFSGVLRHMQGEQQNRLGLCSESIVEEEGSSLCIDLHQ